MFSCILAGLSKITTFVVFIPAIILTITFYGNSIKLSRKNIKAIFSTLFIILLSLLIAKLWTHYTDNIKSNNLLANTYTNSQLLTDWLFGSFRQKFSIPVWNQISNNSYFGISLFKAYILLFIIFLVSNIFNYKNKLLINIFIISYAVGPIIFTNLYYVHDYYFYANTIFLSFVEGIFIHDTLRRAGGNYLPTIIYSLYVILLFFHIGKYMKYFYPFQRNPPRRESEFVSEYLTNVTSENDIVLIYGFDWSPEISYYSKRKSIMDPLCRSISNSIIQKTIKNTGYRNIRAMVVNSWEPCVKSKYFISEKLNYFHFSHKITLLEGFYLYYK
jgi:hypothetical protein